MTYINPEAGAQRIKHTHRVSQELTRRWRMHLRPNWLAEPKTANLQFW
jgi:hypothetical protein